MSDHARVCLVDIEGIATGLSTEKTGLSSLWATEYKPWLVRIPNAPTLSTDPESGRSEVGGLTIQASWVGYSLFEQLKTDTRYQVASAIGKADTSIELVSVSGLSALGGTVWIGAEAITYTGIASNFLTGCSRGQLGTYAQAHIVGANLYTFNPKVKGRRVVVRWLNPYTTTETRRYVGFIDDANFESGEMTLTVISVRQRLMDVEALSGAPFFTGRLARAIADRGNDIKLRFDSKDIPLTDNTGSAYDHSCIRIGDEIVRVDQVVTGWEQTITGLSSGVELSITGNLLSFWDEGDTVELVDSSGNLKATTTIEQLDFSNSIIHVQFSDGYSFASGDKIKASYAGIIPNGKATRGYAETETAAHEAEAEVSEVRVMEGDLISQVFLPLLLSVDGDGDDGPKSGAYDILPEGWGVGLPSDFVDVDTLLDLVEAGRSTPRLYRFFSPFGLSEMLEWIAVTCGASVFFGEDGVLRARIRGDVYPGDTGPYLVDVDSIKEEATISSDVRMDRVYTAWTCPADRNLDGEPKAFLRVVVLEGEGIYGFRPMDEIRDPGIRRESSAVILEQIMKGLLQLRSVELPLFKIPLWLDDSQTWRPGDLLTLTIDYLPNLRGGEGHTTATLEVLSVEPLDADGRVNLMAILRDTNINVGLVAPCLLVESVDDVDTFTARSTSVSHYTDPNGRTEDIPFKDGDGDEDIDFFQPGDKIAFWDESTLDGTPTTSGHGIDEIDYATRQVICDTSLPGWLAAGDLVRLDVWSVVKLSSVSADRIGIYLALADASELIGSDAPYLWGV